MEFGQLVVFKHHKQALGSRCDTYLYTKKAYNLYECSQDL